MNKFFIAFFMLMTMRSSAQTDSVRTIDEVVITANRFPQKQINTGKVMTVVTQREIEKSPYQSLAEILSTRPVKTSSRGNPGNPVSK